MRITSFFNWLHPFNDEYIRKQKLKPFETHYTVTNSAIRFPEIDFKNHQKPKEIQWFFNENCWFFIGFWRIFLAYSQRQFADTTQRQFADTTQRQFADTLPPGPCLAMSIHWGGGSGLPGRIFTILHETTLGLVRRRLCSYARRLQLHYNYTAITL